MSFLNCVDMLMAEVLCLYVFSSKVEKLLNCVFRNSLLLLCLQMLVTVLESTNPSDHCVFLGLEVYAKPQGRVVRTPVQYGLGRTSSYLCLY